MATPVDHAFCFNSRLDTIINQHYRSALSREQYYCCPAIAESVSSCLPGADYIDDFILETFFMMAPEGKACSC
jgi:hypothetical protein